MAAKKNATPAQVALDWVLAQKPWIVPIPGTTKVERMRENCGAADVSLSSQDLSEISAGLSKLKAVGNRYNEFTQQKIDR